jgi:hypothetical protein
MENLTVEQRALVQFAIDKVIEQGCASAHYTEGSTLAKCRYRGPNGTRCAVGHLIADEFYDPAFEGGHVASTPILMAVSKSYPLVVDIESMYQTLSRLQEAHDVAALHKENFIEEFKRRLEKNGIKYC